MSTQRFSPGQRETPPKVDSGMIPGLRESLKAPRPIPRTKMQIVIPAIIAVAFVGMIVLIFSQPALRSGPVGVVSFLFPVMMLGSFAMMFSGNRFGGGDSQSLTPAQMEVARRDYMSELDDVRDVVHEDAAKQFNQFQWLHPEPTQLIGLVGSVRMWERGGGKAGWRQ